MDAQGFRSDLQRLLEQPTGQELRLPVYDRQVTHDPLPEALRIAPENQCICVEGLFALHFLHTKSESEEIQEEELEEQLQPFALRLFLDLPPAVLLRRLWLRKLNHIKFRGRPELSWEHIRTVDLANSRLVRAARAWGDVSLSLVPAEELAMAHLFLSKHAGDSENSAAGEVAEVPAAIREAVEALQDEMDSADAAEAGWQTRAGPGFQLQFRSSPQP